MFVRHLKAILSAGPAIAVTLAMVAAPADGAGGDLLVAPTRVVLDASRGTEVILNNIGAEPATYRVSLELRRMTPEGELTDVAPEDASAAERLASEMISYAPRRVVLAPNQPQAIRIRARAPAGLADGEYRAHMLFRAIPDATPVTEAQDAGNGVAISLIPIYGVTIPIIIRQGNLQATAAVTGARLDGEGEEQSLEVTLSREGDRSVYGELRVLKPGIAQPVFAARGVAVYPEVTSRRVSFQIPKELAAALAGPATIQYREDPDAGGALIAESQVVLR